MNVYEMEGFLRGKCLPGDMKVNESNAQYLVRKFSELQSQNADMAVQLANAESKLRELAAENVGLKNFIINDCHVVHIEPETLYEEEIIRYVSADGYEPETPASDAFLAEVWAQGVEMLAAEYESKIEPYKNHDEFMNAHYLKMQAIEARNFAAQLRKGGAA